MLNKPINVTKSFLPPINEYVKMLEMVWESGQLTNRGNQTLELEKKLLNYLKANYIIITNNGTVPLQIALNKFGDSGEIITTPFSYVATTSSIVWSNCKPIFVDIDPEHLTINENLIEEAITENTKAILATHVFGNPCNIEIIQDIANRHNIKVIYDAAHCFAVKYKGESIFNYGDVSTCSFHATKLFHTGEGGAVFCNDEDLHRELYYRHNFGHNGPYDFHGVGINAKISELQSAMGLSVLPYIDQIIKERAKVVDYYLNNLDWSNLKKIKLREGTEWNYSYFPVIFNSEEILLRVLNKLNELEIFPRRYFFPSLNKLNYISNVNMNVSENISSRILCLPLYMGLTKEDLDKIVAVLNLNS
jgi:dTDP-4-amino-4,6-dideoxygalactose transaminase